MAEARTERGACRFVVEKAEGGKPVIKLQLFHGVSVLNHAVLGFDLLGGLTVDQGKEIADMLNEKVLNVFVTVSDAHPLFELKK